MGISISASFEACRQLTRHHAKSFYFSSHTLPLEKRQAAYAIYAYCRHVDDTVDEATDPAGVQVALAQLRALTDSVYRETGRFSEREWLPAFQATVRRYGIPRNYFEDLLRGVAMDQGKVRLQTWEELKDYCYCVASVVGLMMTRVLTDAWEDALAEPAMDLGTAMQLTNILRDVAEDWGRDRIYLPAEELSLFGLGEEDIRLGRCGEPFEALMRFQVGRAREYYGRSEAGIRHLPADGSQLTVWLMRDIYSGILDEIAAAKYNVFLGRVHVSTVRKLWLALGAWQKSRATARHGRSSTSTVG